MQASEIRRLFLEYFQGQGHREVPSSSLLPADDPTLLFTNAGMKQFKRTFLGAEPATLPAGGHLPEVRPRRRQAQRSRTGGPHQAAPHLLRDAGQLLLRRLLQARRDRLCLGVRDQPGRTSASRPSGCGSRCTTPTHEARALWREISGLPDDRIYGLGDKDNFWQMGDTGPCGPCTEIYVDLEWDARGRGRRAGECREAEFEAPGRGRAVPRDLESRLHAVRPQRRRHADAAAQAVGGHRRGTGADRGGAAGRGQQLPHGSLPAAARAGGGAGRGSPTTGARRRVVSASWPTTPAR